MKPIHKHGVWVFVVVLMGFSGCENATSSQTAMEHHHDHSHEGAHGHPHPHGVQELAAHEDFIQIGAYQFKLSPEVMASGETHLDFFVHDLAHRHVSGVKGVFHVTLPDGSKETLSVEEEQPGNHYHGRLRLAQYGEVQVVAQVAIGDEKYNPRFRFERQAK